MILSLILSLCSPAAAGDFITSIGEDGIMGGDDIGGINWARVFNNPADGDWWVTYHWQAEGMPPGYKVAPMSDERVLEHRAERIHLAEWDDTKDHGISRCPDGSFLHVYSVGEGNESARAARYSMDWEILSDGWIEEGEHARAHNDPPVICSEHRQGAAFTNHSDLSSTVFDIAADGTPSAAGGLENSNHLSGASWVYDASRNQYLVVSNGTHDAPGLRRAWYNLDLTLAESINWSPVAGLERAYWPQKIERVGDYWLLTHLGIEYSDIYSAGDGDVYLVVMNDSFHTVDSAKLSTNTPGELGSARPHFARRGATVMAVWDKGNQPYAVKVELNADALGIGSEDTGTGWGESDSDSDGGGGGGGGDGDGDEDDGSGDSYDPCASSRDGDSGADPTAGEGESSGSHSQRGLTGMADTAATDGTSECDKEGCGCSASPANRTPWALLVLAAGLVARRRPAG